MNKPALMILRQRGGALILFLMVFVLGITALFLSGLNHSWLIHHDLSRTQQSLVRAKEALLGYAVGYYDRFPGEYGFLPCPDLGSGVEGIADLNCQTLDKSSLGKLPWRTLGIPALRDGSGECLWYAVAGPYKSVVDSEKSLLLNGDTLGLFSVQMANGESVVETLIGNGVSDQAVAVIVAPGRILSGQIRAQSSPTCPGNYQVNQYLESDVVGFAQLPNQMENFLTILDLTAYLPEKTMPINDRVAYISQDELWNAIYRRTTFYQSMQCLTKLAAYCVSNYVRTNPLGAEDKRLPWAAPVDLNDYASSSEYTDKAGLLLGRLPNQVDQSNASIGKTAPEELLMDCDFSGIVMEEFGECGGLPNGLSVAFSTLWRHWKDHLFYAVAKAHTPDSSVPTEDCESSHCLELVTEGGVELCAAVVIFAGPVLTGFQSPRYGPPSAGTDTKGNIQNYLESPNFTNTAGYGQFLQYDQDQSINDIIYCVKN